jgi:hypothetical protein
VRCGFATYFQPGQALDHWITEYRYEVRAGWVRLDSEILGADVLHRPEDLTRAEFLTGGEAWQAFRRAVEVLPRDEWGRMTEAYDGKTASDYDELLDQLADVCARDEPTTVAAFLCPREPAGPSSSPLVAAS